MLRNHSYSLIVYHSAQERNRCGYCNHSNTSYTHGMTAHQLNIQNYQSLLDRGWRRCGSYCYKSMMKTTCCPLYTIKCEALNFQLSKSQKKIMKRMIRFLKNELPKNEDITSPVECDEDIDRNMEIPECSKFVSDKANKDASKMQVSSVSEELQNRLGYSMNETESNPSTSKSVNENSALPSQAMEITKDPSSSVNFDPTKAPQKKAKFLRIEKKKNKLLAQGKTIEEIDALMNKNKPQNTGKTLDDFFEEMKNCSNKLELKLIRTTPKSDSYNNSAKESFELYKKYQTSIHFDKLSKLTQDRYERFLVESSLLMKLKNVMSDDFLETLSVSAKLYEKYQTIIHKDPPEECDQKSFFDFLVRNPWKQWKPDSDGPAQGYGSFHEQYWLNDTLIAVAVLDILPFCLSSVYFFYDPSYSHLSLGTFSSLREIYLTQQLNKTAPSLKFYYMGYYIHTCPKMRYKAKMRPSKLLCPETYEWCDIEKCLPKLDVSKYSRFNEDSSGTDEDGIVDLNQVLVLYNRRAMQFGVFESLSPYSASHMNRIKDQVKEYAELVGRDCAYKMLYYIG